MMQAGAARCSLAAALTARSAPLAMGNCGRRVGGGGLVRRAFKTKSTKLSNVMETSVSPGKAVPSGSLLGASAGMGSVLAFMQASPFTAQVTIATVKTSVADLIVQKRVEGRPAVDWQRNALFIMFGGAYLGVFQWFVYVRLFQRLFPAMTTFCNQPVREKIRNRAGIKSLFGQIALDFVFIQPIVYFPVFYGFKTLLEPDLQGTGARARAAFDKWRANFVQDNLGMCAFWLPMDIVIYSVPVWLRLPLNHSISFIWCCVLSLFRGGDKEEEAVEAAL